MTEKQTGNTLLIGGIIVMILAVGIIILLFTGRINPIPLLNIPAPTLNTGSLVPNVPGLPKAQGQDIVIIPTKDFNHMLNLGIQFLFMTFIMSFGFKLADLGTKLLRPIKIQEK